MTTNSVVRARIDQRIKDEAAAVLAAMGLTVSDAFRLMMVRIAKDKALPFEPLVSNAETIERCVGSPKLVSPKPWCGLRINWV